MPGVRVKLRGKVMPVSVKMVRDLLLSGPSGFCLACIGPSGWGKCPLPRMLTALEQAPRAIYRPACAARIPSSVSRSALDSCGTPGSRTVPTSVPRMDSASFTTVTFDPLR